MFNFRKSIAHRNRYIVEAVHLHRNACRKHLNSKHQKILRLSSVAAEPAEYMREEKSQLSFSGNTTFINNAFYLFNFYSRSTLLFGVCVETIVFTNNE